MLDRSHQQEVLIDFPIRKPMTYWKYQCWGVQEIIDHYCDFQDMPNPPKYRMILLDSYMGSGKTSMLMGSAAYLLSRGLVDAVLVLTPMRDIGDSFKSHQVEVQFPPSVEDNTQGWTVDCAKEIRVTTKGSEVAKIRAHLKDPPQRKRGEGILVSTVAAANKFFEEEKKNPTKIDWSRVLIIVDEGHHVSANFGDSMEWDTSSNPTGLGLFVRDTLEKGATAIMASATFWRSNSNETICSKDARRVKIPYLAYAEESGAPTVFKNILVSSLDPNGLQDMEVSTEKQLNGEGSFSGSRGSLSKADAERVASYLADRANIDGKPYIKALIRFNRIKGTNNIRNMTNALRREWKKRGWDIGEIVDGTGPNADLFLRKLKEEQQVKTFADSKVDFFLVCGRGTEGTNWPLCSHTVSLGAIGTTNTFEQFSGRNGRSKVGYTDYPDHLRDERCHITFIPKVSEKDQSKVFKIHHEGTLLIGCFMHSYETAKEFVDIVEWQLHKVLRSYFPPSPPSGGPRGTTRPPRDPEDTGRDLSRWRSALNRYMPSHQDLAEAGQIIGNYELLDKVATGKKPSVADITTRLLQDPNLTTQVKIAGVLLSLATVEKSGGASDITSKVKDAIESFVKEVTATPLEDADIEKGFIAHFSAVALQFEKISSMQLEGQLEFESKIRAKESEEFFLELQKGLPMPAPSYSQATQAVKQWYQEHPHDKKIHGDLSKYFHPVDRAYSADHLKRDIKRRLEGQPSSVFTLDDLLREERCL